MDNILAIADFASALNKLVAKGRKSEVTPLQIEQVFEAVVAKMLKEANK